MNQQLEKTLNALSTNESKKFAKVIEAVREHLQEAVQFSEAGDFDSEWKRLFRAEKWAKESVLTGGLLIYEEIKSALHKDGLILRGARKIGVIQSVSDGKTSYVFSDRILNGDQAFRLEAGLSFSIFVDGVDQFVTTSSGTAGVAISPLGIGLGLASTNHKNLRMDMRVCTFVATSPKWQIQTTFHSSQLESARVITEKLRSQFTTAALPSASSGAIDVQLTNLADLFAKGLINTEEFASAKKKLLGI